MTSRMGSGMGGSAAGLAAVVFTNCTALGPLMRRFSNSSSDAVPDPRGAGSAMRMHPVATSVKTCGLRQAAGPNTRRM